LKFHGKDRKGLSTKALTAIDKKLAKVAANIDHLVDKENTAYEGMSTATAMGGGKCRSADRDLAATGLVLSPRKRRRVES
jgi:formiminotetrahydrofolate cyclodeaminase